MNSDNQVVAMLRGQPVDIVSGLVFFSFGLAACIVAAIRRRSGLRVVWWLGIWSAMYGVLQLDISAEGQLSSPSSAGPEQDRQEKQRH